MFIKQFFCKSFKLQKKIESFYVVMYPDGNIFITSKENLPLTLRAFTGQYITLPTIELSVSKYKEVFLSYSIHKRCQVLPELLAKIK